MSLGLRRVDAHTAQSAAPHAALHASAACPIIQLLHLRYETRSRMSHGQYPSAKTCK